MTSDTERRVIEEIATWLDGDPRIEVPDSREYDEMCRTPTKLLAWALRNRMWRRT